MLLKITAQALEAGDFVSILRLWDFEDSFSYKNVSCKKNV